MKNDKAPGCSKVSTNMLKILPEEEIQFITSIIREYWMDINCQVETWNIQKLIGLHKGREDVQNINNWIAYA